MLFLDMLLHEDDQISLLPVECQPPEIFKMYGQKNWALVWAEDLKFKFNLPAFHVR